MTPRDAIRNAAAALEARGVPDSLYDAAQLLSFLTGKNALLLRLDTDTELTEETLAAFHDLCARRAQRDPLQYILGSVSFLAHEFHADARALIPRPETELLAERVIALVTDGSLRSVLDLCCGTGCIGISIALACPDCVVTLSDLSHDALSLAQENAAALGASVQFLEGDLFTPTGAAAYHLIVSNPPYIPSEDCLSLQAEVLLEPHMALEGGRDGLDFYRRIAQDAPAHLHRGGHLLVECGDGEAQSISALFAQAGFDIVGIYEDFQSLPRIVHAQLPHSIERFDADHAGKVSMDL